MELYEIISHVTKFMISLILLMIGTNSLDFLKPYLGNITNSNNVMMRLATQESPQIIAATEKVVSTGTTVGSIFGTIVNTLCIIFVIFVIIWILMSVVGNDDDSSAFGNSMNNTINASMFSNNKRTLEPVTKVTFKDVAGLEEAKQDVQRYVDIMKNRDKYLKMGAKLPRGFLMLGPPGCGKTLLAKAIAGEAGVNFIAASGSDFDEMYVGVGASRVRDLFYNARKNAPCIIFIDEIDGVGSKRGQLDNREHDKTLNAMLVSIDGFEEAENILVIGATNRADTLDNALLRSGRFDKQISIGNPTLSEREEMFQMYLKKTKLDEDADIEEFARELSKITPGINGADIANICNHAAILAVAEESEHVTLELLKRSIEDVCIGGERRSRKVSDKELKTVAYHECGHAILGYMLKHTGSPLTISIIPRGPSALGYTLPDVKDVFLKSKTEYIEEIAALMGGRIAEEVFCKDITGGASNDIEKATNIAYAMCTQYGMSKKIGRVQMSVSNGRSYTPGVNISATTQAEIDKVVKDLIDNVYVRAKELIVKHKNDVHKLAKELLEKEELKKDRTHELLGPDIESIYSLTDIEF